MKNNNQKHNDLSDSLSYAVYAQLHLPSIEKFMEYEVSSSILAPYFRRLFGGKITSSYYQWKTRRKYKRYVSFKIRTRHVVKKRSLLKWAPIIVIFALLSLSCEKECEMEPDRAIVAEITKELNALWEKANNEPDPCKEKALRMQIDSLALLFVNPEIFTCKQ